MNLIGTRNIETERCILRRIVPTDYIAMYENWAKYDEVCKYYSDYDGSAKCCFRLCV